MLRDFPSVMSVQIHPKVPDPTLAKRLIGQVLSSLRESGEFNSTGSLTSSRSVFDQYLSLRVTGSQGVYLEFRSNDRRMMDFLKTLNFFQVLRVEGLPANLVVMGTKL